MQFAPRLLDPANLSEVQKCIALKAPSSVDPGMQFAEDEDYDASLSSLGSLDTFFNVSGTIDYHSYARRPDELSRLKAEASMSDQTNFIKRRELQITFLASPHFALTRVCFCRAGT